MTGTFATVEDAFRAFRADPVERLRVNIRRLRAEQIRSMAEQPNAVTLDQFNRDVWALESATLVDGNEVSKGWLIDTGGGLTTTEAADLDRALDEGRVELHGNYTWKAESGVYSPGKDDTTRLANARSALRLLADKALTPAEKARRIDDVPGFGDCAATGLVMLAHPKDFAIYNGPSVAAVKALGLPTGSPAEFQASARGLRDRLGADDFIELDWFLYLLNQKAITVGLSQPAPPPPNPSATGSPEYWVIALGEGGRLWKECRDAGIIAIGWDQLGDLRLYGTKEDILTKLSEGREPEAPRPTHHARICHEFSRAIKPGDIVFVKKGNRELLGAGSVTGDYEFRADRAEYKHVRSVRWAAEGSWQIPDNSRPTTKALTNVTHSTGFLAFAKPLLAGTGAGTPPPPSPAPSGYTIDHALDGVFMPREQFQAILAGLARKKNAILQGPPGVGKSFLARRLAYCLVGAADPTRVQGVQFHQSYSYEDFVQGWRPAETGFARRDGVFHHFCTRAAADPKANYVFVIDEINRGNLSKVFGELFLLIEADKRGKEFAIPLTYSRDPSETFCVPENVYLIGLMNTADRSLAMVDYALRRRFAFHDLRPGFSHPAFRERLADAGVEPEVIDCIVTRMAKLNEHIRAETAGLGPGFEVGHSFFCPQGTEEDLDLAWYRAVVEGEIAPLLREYWFDDLSKAEGYVAELLA
jgi:5-methylcytosine-specific restriction protein B